MKVTFWGVRGSLPTPLTTTDYHRKLARILAAAQGVDLSSAAAIGAFCETLPPELRRVVGGNSSCVEVEGNGHRVICDAGSGIRPLGHDLIARAAADDSFPRVVHLLVSHTHWDHICGFPFFAPLYHPEWEIHVWGAHEHLEQRMRTQHHPHHFPVPFETFTPRVTIHRIPVGESVEIGGLQVRAGLLDHPGDCYAYRIESPDGADVIYGTDGAYDDEPKMTALHDAKFFDDAGALIFDSMFTPEDAETHKDWGHSTAHVGLALALAHGVRRLILFHHDPDHDDLSLYRSLRDAEDFVHEHDPSGTPAVDLACEGWSFEIPARSGS